MPHVSRAERLSRLERVLLSPNRYVDALLEVRAPDGELIFAVGGCWDTTAGMYVDRPAKPHVAVLKWSQVPMARAIGRYLDARRRNDDTRPMVIMALGKRGGGKTWIGGLLIVAIALAFPKTWQIACNITSKQKREVFGAIQQVARPEWIKSDIADFRDPRTIFLTASGVLWLSSKNPGALRQAGLVFEHVLVNEGQDQSVKVFTNAVSAVRNTGGLVSVAANPPQEERGDWVASVYQAITAEEVAGEAYELDPAENDSIHQASQPKIRKLLYAADRLAGEADADGIMKLSGDRAYPGFSSMPRERGGNIGEPPQVGWFDVTRELTADGGNGFDYVAGADFQKTPGSCAVVGKLYRREDGVIVLWVKDFIATQGVEEDLSHALWANGYFPGPVDFDGKPAASCVIVGDATGARQNAEHRKRDPYSFTRLQADGWKVLPPCYHFRTRVPWYPLVRDSRSQMHSLLRAGQVLLASKCAEPQPGFPSLVESFKQAKARTDGGLDKKGHFQHGPDGVRYLAWRYLPRPQPPIPDQGIDADTFEELRKIRVLKNG